MLLTLATVAAAAGVPATSTSPAQLDLLMLTGFLAAIIMFTTGPYVRGSRPAAYLFAAATATLGAYCFAVGAWPAGVVAIAAAFLVCWSRAVNFRTTLDRWWSNVTRAPIVTIDPVRGRRLAALFDDTERPFNPRPQSAHWRRPAESPYGRYETLN